MTVAEPRRPFWRPFFAIWALLTVLMSFWAVATPIGGAPDEPAHLIKGASVARGEFVGEPGSFGHIVHVPRYIAYSGAHTCYAFDSDREADCGVLVPEPESELMEAATTAGLYNPLYYVLTGWPSLVFGDSVGIYAMRVMSALLVAGFLALAGAVVSTWTRRSIPFVGFAAAVTPMVLFLGGTVNPNSLEIAATLAAFAALLTVARNPGQPLVRNSAIVLAGAAVAANMRGLSILWLAVALLAPFILMRGDRILDLLRRRPVQLAIGGSALAFVAAMVWLFGSNSLGAGVGAEITETISPGVGAPWYYGAWWTFQATLDYLVGAVGVFGWLDTPAPLFVLAVWTTLMGALFLVAAVMLRGRALVFALVLVVATVALPPIMQAVYITGGGVIWQGRYILPVLVCAALGVAAVASDRVPLGRPVASRLVLVVSVLWAVAQFHGFATALRRYGVGMDGSWADLLTAAEWAPPGGLLVSLGGFALTIVVAGIAAVLLARRGAQDAELTTTASSSGHTDSSR